MGLKQAHLLELFTNDQGTVSALMCGGGLLCYMLELPERGNKPCLSRIPRGREYICKYLPQSASGKYRKCWHVQNVESRSGILTHAGNYAGDIQKGFKTHSLGCLLPALKIGKLGGQLAGLQSKSALAKINQCMNQQTFILHT